MSSKGDQLGPVLYWQLSIQSYLEDGSKYHATEWRTIPDYQGGMSLLSVRWISLMNRFLAGRWSPFRRYGPKHSTFSIYTRCRLYITPSRPYSTSRYNHRRRPLVLLL